jgi:hypothetical protein
MPAYRADEITPPDSRFSVELLADAIRSAVDAVRAPLPDELGGGEVAWGNELEARPISENGEAVGARRCAGYLARYATKSTELAGGLPHRITPDDVDSAPVREHVRRYMRAASTSHEAVEDAAGDQVRAALPAETAADPERLALRVLRAMSHDERVALRLSGGGEVVGCIMRRTPTELSLDTGETVQLDDVRVVAAAPWPEKRNPRDRRLAACAHALGYRGHCLTKSRRYSTTFRALREARERHVHERLLRGDAGESQRELAETALAGRVAYFTYAGRGHFTTADAYLAASAANRARESRQIAREELRAATIDQEVPGER